RRRNDQARRRHRDDARALSRHRRGVSRRHEREGAARVLEHRRGGAVHRRQPGAADRNHGLRAQPGLPDVPTVAESGLPGFDFDLWIGIHAPAGLPPAVLAKLNGEINKVLQHPELKSAFAKIGITPRGTTPDQGAAFTRSEYEKWKKVIVDG